MSVKKLFTVEVGCCYAKSRKDEIQPMLNHQHRKKKNASNLYSR